MRLTPATISQRIPRLRVGRRRAFHLVLLVLSVLALGVLLGNLVGLPPTGKQSRAFWALALAAGAVMWMGVRSLLVLGTNWGLRTYSTGIPLWEQGLLVANEAVAIGVAAYFASDTLTRFWQPNVFTIRTDYTYALGVGGAAVLYYLAMQFMWVQRWNDFLGRTAVWLTLARLVAPLLLAVASLLIVRPFLQQEDPRTASLQGGGELDFAVLGLAPVIWLMILAVLLLVFTGRRGLRQRFLPDELLARLPERLRRVLSAISDMDLLLIVVVLTTFVPVYLLLSGGSGGVLGALRQFVLRRGSVVLETGEQALAIVFVLPFYLLILALLVLYAVVVFRSTLSAHDRDALLRRLPLGTLITFILTLYLFAVPFTQVFVAGELPSPTRDLGRILVFYVAIPLVLLYAHYLPLVRLPYARGQNRWREQFGAQLEQELRGIDTRIRTLNQEIRSLERSWQTDAARPVDAVQNERLETLYRYVQLNSERDDLNMQRLQIVTQRQELTEISETPLNVRVTRLPARILGVGIPLLIVVQIYQWAVLNEGLREVVNNPNLTLLEFVQIVLDNIQF